MRHQGSISATTSDLRLVKQIIRLWSRWSTLTQACAWFTIGLFVLFIVNFTYFGLSMANQDSLLFYSSFSAARRFGSWLDLQTFAFGQAFGAFQHPVIYNLMWWLQDIIQSVQLTYMSIDILMFGSIFVFAYWLSNSVSIAGISAWLTTSFFFFPLLAIDYFGCCAPQVCLQISLVYLGLGLIGFGLMRPIWLGVGFAVILIIVAMDWIFIIFSLPVIVIVLVAIFLSGWFDRRVAPQPGVMLCLVLATVVSAAVIWRSGVFDAYNSFTEMSVRAWASGDGYSDPRHSLLFWKGLTGSLRLAPFVAWAAVASMLFLTWLRRPFWVLLCPSILAWLGVLVLLDIDSTGVDVFWTLPRIGYFERAIIPFYTVAIVYGLAEVSRKLIECVGEDYQVSSAIYIAFRRPLLLTAMFLFLGLATFMIVRIWAKGGGAGQASYITEWRLIPFYAAVIALGVIAMGNASTSIWRRGGRNNKSSPSGLALGLTVLAAGSGALVLLCLCLVASGNDIRASIYRRPYYWDRVIDFVDSLPLEHPLDPLHNPYFFDATHEALINNCPQLHDIGQPPRGPRYCGEMMNLVSARNFNEFQNLLDIQVAGMADHAETYVNVAAGWARATGTSSVFDYLKPLKSLGIRYVAIDGVDPKASTVLSLEQEHVALLDLGDIEPTDISARTTAFDSHYDREEVILGRRDGVAVVHNKGEFEKIGQLVPASLVNMAYRDGAISVRARSTGSSIIYLPFQFSHCLQITEGGGPQTELLRIDGAQAALRFDGDADVVISNRLTYFGDTNCRHQDFVDVWLLGLWPVQSYDEIVGKHRAPFLMKLYLEKRLRIRDSILRAKPAS